MDIEQLIIHIISISWLILICKIASGLPISKPNCPSHCENNDVIIPYPFGIGAGCYVDEWFELVCINKTTPFLKRTNLEVMRISVEKSTLQIRNPITFINCSTKETKQSANLEGSPFVFSQKNRFTAVACGATALMTLSSGRSTIISGCSSYCNDPNHDYICNSTIKCCQTNIPLNLNVFDTSFHSIKNVTERECKFAFLADQDWFNSISRNVSEVYEMVDVPVDLDWVLYHSTLEVFGSYVDTNDSYSSLDGNCPSRFDVDPHQICYRDSICYTYHVTSSSFYNQSARLQCSCPGNDEGNPYLVKGCQGISPLITKKLVNHLIAFSTLLDILS